MKSAAFLVGINSYKRAPLRGCVPDVRAMAELLTEQFDLPSHRLYTLVDAQATRAEISRGLQWLARQGADIAYFIYSGHGTRIPDRDGDEARQGSGTSYDQAIVPVDYEQRGLILDDELGDIYATFPPQTKLIVHLDSCFSAKAERGLADLYRRYVRRRVPRVLPSHLLPANVIEAAQTRQAAVRTLPLRQIVLLSGCRDFETSADAYLGGQYRGAMTYYLQKSIRALGPDASYLEVIEDARRLLAINGFPQIPHVSGPWVWLHMPIYT